MALHIPGWGRGGVERGAYIFVKNHSLVISPLCWKIVQIQDLIHWQVFSTLGCNSSGPSRLIKQGKLTVLIYFEHISKLTIWLISFLKTRSLVQRVSWGQFLAFTWIRIFHLISEVIQGSEESDLLVLQGICSSFAFCIKDLCKKV